MSAATELTAWAAGPIATLVLPSGETQVERISSLKCRNVTSRYGDDIDASLNDEAVAVYNEQSSFDVQTQGQMFLAGDPKRRYEVEITDAFTITIDVPSVYSADGMVHDYAKFHFLRSASYGLEAASFGQALLAQVQDDRVAPELVEDGPIYPPDTKQTKSDGSSTCTWRRSYKPFRLNVKCTEHGYSVSPMLPSRSLLDAEAGRIESKSIVHTATIVFSSTLKCDLPPSVPLE